MTTFSKHDVIVCRTAARKFKAAAKFVGASESDFEFIKDLESIAERIELELESKERSVEDVQDT